MLITPESAVQLVLSRKLPPSKRRFQLYETQFQKWSWWISVCAFMLGLILGILAFFDKSQFLVLSAIWSIIISTAFIVAYQIANIWSMSSELRKPPEEALSNPLVSGFNNDLDLIHELSQSFELHHLQFAKVSYQRMAKQLRERIGVIVGAIDKVGIFPLALTGYLSFAKAQKEGLFTFGGAEWTWVALLVLYLSSVRMISAVQWMEMIADLFEQSAAAKIKLDAVR